MKKIAEFICRHKISIVIMSVFLLIPSIIGMSATRINYDILVYLPDDIDTVKGQEILTEDFHMGSFSAVIVEEMKPKDILKLEETFRDIKGVEKVASVSDVTGTSIPEDFLPKEALEKVKKGNSQLMIVTFRDSISADETLDAVDEMRTIADHYCKFGGMSSIVLDTQQVANQEVAIYTIVAATLCLIVLLLALDSWLVPFILLGNIGIAILYNMGTNYFLGDISYITKAISSVLQLGVTTDFSIFLYHKYEKAKQQNCTNHDAMVTAICETTLSVMGSSITTIAGFLTLCTMSLKLGADIGIVMAKGVALGVFSVLTIFPAYLLLFDKWITKTTHRHLLPKMQHIQHFVIAHHKIILVIFVLLFVPAAYGNANTEVYYNLNKSLPQDLQSSIANRELKEQYDIVSPQVILVDRNMESNKLHQLVNKLDQEEGINLVLSGAKLTKMGMNEAMLPDEIKELYVSGDYQAILINSTYETATNQLNHQIDHINSLVKKYDSHAIVAGEGPLMKDMVEIADHDFKVVNAISIIVIFIIMAFVLKSLLLPVILVLAIEFAIMMNMAFAYFGGVTLPFVASIVIGTIQLGATIDYAILMTTKYVELRKNNVTVIDAVKEALYHSSDSIFVSGLCFFAATFGVGLISKLDMIASICTLLSRGALISMATVILILPALLLLFDKAIMRTTIGCKGGTIE